MDRFFLLGLILSAGMHTAVIARVPVPGERGDALDLPAGLELRYVETAELPGPLHLQAPGAVFSPPDGGDDAEASAASAAPVAYAGRGEDVPLRKRIGGVVPKAEGFGPQIRGTGEVLRASVKETLRPLLGEGVPRDEELSSAVHRYKTRLEAILERESRLVYPDPAKDSGHEARLQIRFSLLHDGSLESVELPPACGGFEQELVAGLRKAARHFPAFPEEIRCSRLTFCWPVRFNLY